jgi:hypothetical protein
MKKKATYIICVFVLLCACQQEQEIGMINYESKPIHSKFLAVNLVLNGIQSTHSLKAKITISNIYEKPIKINDIAIGTTEGIWTSTESGLAKFVLKSGLDTTFELSFLPVNNVKLYQFTGLNGLLQSNYQLRIDFNDELTEYDLNIQNTMPNEVYENYKRANIDTVGLYSFDMNSEFSDNQKEYESRLAGMKNESNFINISEHELAISGLNFRLHAYQKKDTLYGELNIVNHGDFDVQADTSVLGFRYKNSNNIAPKLLSILKTSGSTEPNEYTILRKGDRIVIKIKQLISKEEFPNVVFILKDALILKTNESLFFSDIPLIRDVVVL